MKKKRKMISLKGWMHYLFFVMRRHKRISLLGYIIYNTYYIGRPHALMRGQTSPQSINEKTTTCDRVDMENNNGLSFSEYFMRSGANENIIKLFLCRAGQSVSSWHRRREPSKGPVSRSRAVYAKLESNSEPERARVCQRVAMRASESGSHREP